MTRAQRLMQLATETKEQIENMPHQPSLKDRENAEYLLIAAAVVKGFDILMGEKP